MRTLTITYDETQLDCDGNPLDLFDYLMNELDNADVVCEMTETESHETTEAQA